MSSPPIWIYEDPARGLALLRGQLPDMKNVLELAAMADVARWSTTGKGFVVPLDAMPNIAAMADYAGTPYRIKQVTG